MDHGSRLWEVARLFIKLGFTSFGGPAAHLALMHQEVVVRRKWLDEQGFLDLLGACNLIPGPTSTEMAIHLGYLRAGWPGLLVGGAGFILPAVGIVLALSWAYVRFGTLPQAAGILYGIKPMILAIILQALWALGRKAMRGWLTGLVGLGGLALYLFGVNEILLLFAGGLLVMFLRAWRDRDRWLRLGGGLGALALSGLPAESAPAAAVSLWGIFLSFLKIGSILYGSGYVLLAFLHAEFVQRLSWLSEQQLVDAIALGQITPGPLFTSATFIGYLLLGVPGGLLATLGIFLPSFVFVAVTNPWIPRMRQSPWLGALLDGVNAVSLGLMMGVTLQLGRATLIDLPTLLLFGLAAVLVLRFHVNATRLILLGGLIGMILKLFVMS